MSDHYAKLESMYHTAPVNELLAARITVGNGTAKIDMPVKPEYFHGFESVHGSIYFKLLDDAAYFAAASEVTDRCIVTVSFSIQMMKPVSGGEMHAEGHLISNSGRIFVAESQVVDSDGALVAIGHGTFAKSGLRLSEAVGYR